MGGKKSSAPDYTPMAQASVEAARIMADLGYKQMDMAKDQYDRALPFMEKLARSQIDMQDQAVRQGDDYYQYMQDTYRPLEKRLVADAEAFNTASHRERLAGEAGASVEQQMGLQRGAMERQMASMGVNPNSGRFMAMANQNQLMGAAARANATNQTRTQAEQLGYARRLDAAGLGRNLPGLSNSAYGLALNAGNSAGNNFQAPGTQLLQGHGMGVNTVGSGQQMKIQGLGNVLNAQTQMAISDNNKSSPFGAILGAGLNWAMGSAKRYKDKLDDIDPIVVSYQFENLDIDRWQYKEGLFDEGVHIGPYAEDVQELGMSNGDTVDLLSMIGMTMAAVQGIAQRLAKIEEKLG